MADTTSLDDRMKENYEKRSRTYLTRRTPVIVRVDGKAFHSFTKGFNKPYDLNFQEVMINTAISLCSNIQNCKFGYVQSDEISLLLTDYDKLTTAAWFDYAVQKIVSVSASMATLYFNQHFNNMIINAEDLSNEMIDLYIRRMTKGALFDSRVFNIPESEVTNYFLWRQQDATRNSIQMLGHAYFSDKELFKLNTNQIQDKLMNEKSINWSNLDTYLKRGTGVVKNITVVGKTADNPEYIRSEWIADKEMPVISQNREYIEQYLGVPDTK